MARSILRQFPNCQYDRRRERHGSLKVAMDLDLVLKIIASRRRRQILRWLVEPKQHFPPQKDGDLIKDGVCGLLIARKLHVSQPTASDHLNMMVRARMLRAKRIKQWTFYKRDERVISRIRKQMVKSF
jgi:DNA-binding transcriptional ArsR family regulator